MSNFNGFHSGKVHLTQIPEQFFSEIMPLIDDAAELKVTLFAMWALQQKEGDYKYLRYAEFVENETLMAGLQVLDQEGDVDEILDRALEKTIEHNILLSADITVDEHEVCYYVINSERGRTFVEQLKAGEWRPKGVDEIEVLPPRPTIFALYEHNIGVLTPMIIDALKDAEQEYPTEWIEEAIKCAVERNARSWKYISKVLDAWNREGRSRETVQGHNERHERFTGKWADFIES